jgi:hypothetical protein
MESGRALMADSVRRKALVLFGVVMIVFWLSSAVLPQPIPPLAPLPKLDRLVGEVPSWIRQQVAGMNRPDDEILASMRREMIAMFAREWLKIATGVASGILIARRHRLGRWLAISLCVGLLGWFAIGHGRMMWEHHFVYWRAMARYAPQALARITVNLLFYVVTIAYLTHPRVIAWFRPREAHVATV